MAKKTEEEIRKMFSEKGKEKFDILVSNQSINILKHLDWNQEEWEKFMSWWINNHAVVGGTHILKYLESLK